MAKVWKACPKCGSTRLLVDYLDVLDSIGYRRVQCCEVNCNFEWFEQYEHVHNENLDGDILNYKGEVTD